MVHYLMQLKLWLNQWTTELTEVQTVAWYDNENSYTSNMVRTIKYFAELSK